MSSKKWKNRDALVTVFDDEEIAKILKRVINESKFKKRCNDISMCSEGDPSKPHNVTRGDHMEEAAEQAGEIAEGLGLNEIVAENGMLWHDAGQKFGAHDGETTTNEAGEILYTGWCHHSAKGVEVILAERIIPKVIKAIQEAADDNKLEVVNNKELRDRLKNDIWYFMEFVVGHDGEATSKDIERLAKIKR